MKRRHKPHGVTGVPTGTALSFVSLNAERSDGSTYEVPFHDDTSGCEFSEFMDSLTGPETEVIELKVKGFATRRKAQAEALNGMRRKYETLYESERRVAA
jgi:hypothetical protein